MRKDVKLGFAIGGILLAVLVVYVLVVSGGDNSTPSDKNKPVALATDAKSNTNAKPAESTPAPAPAEQPPGRRPGRNRFGASNGGGAAGATPTPPAETSAAPQTETPAPAKPETATSGDPFSPAPSGYPPVAFLKEAASPASQPAADDHWSSALHTGLPVLMTSTPSNPVPAAPVPAVQADANLPTEKPQSGSGRPIMASDAGSNTPAVVGGAEIPIRVSNPPPAAAEAKLPAPSATPTKTVGADQHIIQPGETLSSIAAAAYGNASFYPHILRANPNLDPKKLRPGMTINLPPANQVKAESSSTATASAAPGATPVASPANAKLDEKTEYRIESGDSLMRISSKLYGSIKNVDKLYDLNKSTIGPDKAKLKVGTVLKLPEPPTVK